jgi:hypothetical protein
MRWDYMTIELSTMGWVFAGQLDCKVLTEKLNELGEQGWELNTVLPLTSAGGTTEVVAILKRPSEAKG